MLPFIAYTQGRMVSPALHVPHANEWREKLQFTSQGIKPE